MLAFPALGSPSAQGLVIYPPGEACDVAFDCRRRHHGQAAIDNGDGGQSRGDVCVGDGVRANLAALTRGGGRGINIGTGIETSVNTLFRTLRDLSGSGQQEIHGPAMPGEQRRSCLENRLALDELGWYPEVFLEEGLARTYSFFRETTKATDTW